MKQYIDNQQLNLFKKSLKNTRSILGRKNISEVDKFYGIAGNTFRAYRDYAKSPSVVYRQWAKIQTNKIIKFQPTKQISTSAKFRNWHKNLCDSLNTHWKKKQRKKLSFAHFYKMIDLYIKWLSQFDYPDKNFVKKLNKYASCALDRQTLEKINLCYGKCFPINQPRMGDIFNQNTYNFCQRIINDFCMKASGTKLEFDFWAWKKGG